MSISVSSSTAVNAKKSDYSDFSLANKKENDSAKELQKLRDQKLSLEKKLLEMQSNTDSQITEEQKEQIEEQLEKIEQAIKVAEKQAEALSDSGSSASKARRFDEYVKGSEDIESAGIYILNKNAEGGKNVSFVPYNDGTSESVDSVKADNSGDNVQKTTANTDDVDREIKSLKDEKKNIQAQINSAQSSGKSDEKIDALKQKLTAIESELSQKDNDTYRKQNAEYTNE